MTIESDILDILDLSVMNELLRVRPEEPCRTCTPEQKCYWHAQKFDRQQTTV